MKLASLASSSSGNSIYIGTEKRNILVDAGISYKKICEGLEGLSLLPSDLDAILITHEHSDHIGGLGVFLRKNPLPVYLTEGTYNYIVEHKSLGSVPEDCFQIIKSDSSFMLGDIEVNAYSIFHDAAEPVSYRFNNAGASAAIITDLGKYDDALINKFMGLNALVLETNHDVRMLEMGPYTYSLKRRILGDKGHLSNELAARLLLNINSEQLRFVLLGHISPQNNFPELALEAIKSELILSKAHKPWIGIAPRFGLSEIIEV